NRAELTSLADLTDGDHVSGVAAVKSVSDRKMKYKKGRVTEVQISDGSSLLKLTFFNQSWRKNELKVGARGLFAGKVSTFNKKRQLAHPDYMLLEEDSTEAEAAGFAGALIPIYPLVAGIKPWQLGRAIQF